MKDCSGSNPRYSQTKNIINMKQILMALIALILCSCEQDIVCAHRAPRSSRTVEHTVDTVYVERPQTMCDSLAQNVKAICNELDSLGRVYPLSDTVLCSDDAQEYLQEINYFFRCYYTKDEKTCIASYKEIFRYKRLVDKDIKEFIDVIHKRN